MNQILKLKSPVDGPAGTLAELSFREPTGDDIIESGFPALLQIEVGKRTTAKVEIDAKAIGIMIGLLTGISPRTVGRLSHTDFNKAAGIVGGFFIDSVLETFSTAISTSVSTSAS